MEKLMTIDKACDILDIRKEQGYAMAREGILPVVKVGRQYRIDPETLRKWIQSGGRSFAGGWRKTAAN